MIRNKKQMETRCFLVEEKDKIKREKLFVFLVDLCDKANSNDFIDLSKEKSA